MDKYLLSVEEAARRLGCGRSYLYGLIRKGAISSLKLGSHRRLAVAEVERFATELIEQEAIALAIETKTE